MSTNETPSSQREQSDETFTENRVRVIGRQALDADDTDALGCATLRLEEIAEDGTRTVLGEN